MDTPQSPLEQDQPSATLADGPTTGRAPSGRTLALAVLGAVVAAVVLFALFSGSESPDSNASEISGLTFLTTEGQTATLADYEGEPLVVNFFASWCAPCRAELPEFEAVHQANKGAVTFLGVNHDLDEATWRTFVDETEITYQTVFQPSEEIWSTLDAKGLPSTVFISADGEVLELWTGVLNDELLQQKIDENLLGRT